MMIPVRLFKQSPSHCGPASLKMVLGYLGLEKTEAELAALTKCTEERGTAARDIVAAAQSLGFQAFLKDEASLADIREWVIGRQLPVIIAWFAHDDDHYSVVVDITDTHISIADPETATVERLLCADFEKVWYDRRLAEGREGQAIVPRPLVVISRA